MLRLRRHDLSPRVELLPLIDVIFLLLTFFIYSLIVMRFMPNVLPVKLTPVTAGRTAEPGPMHVLTLDKAGVVYLDREVVAEGELDARLTALAEADPPVKLVIAMEEIDAAARQAELEAAVAAATGDLAAQGTDQPMQVPGAGGGPVDRGPLLMDLIGRVRRAGIENFALVGDPQRR